MKNGKLISAGRANKQPAKSGARAAPVVRATPVMPAVADRSSGRTRAIVYDCRVGTSIWLILNRRKSTRTAEESVGISGTRIRRIFDGRWVNTIVLMRPNREASQDAQNALRPARILAPKKISPSVAGSA